VFTLDLFTGMISVKDILTAVSLFILRVWTVLLMVADPLQGYTPAILTRKLNVCTILESWNKTKSRSCLLLKALKFCTVVLKYIELKSITLKKIN
jgi:hypothetical protein